MHIIRLWGEQEMTFNASMLSVVHWMLPRAGDAPMATKMGILYTILAVAALYFLLPLFFIVFPKVQPKYWLLWAFYYVVAVGLVGYGASSLGFGAIMSLAPWAIGIMLRMLVPASQARERPRSGDEASSSTA